jgi:S-(hydroxymethyl)glutathione dehydrogenase/alcohol dehydrogenase
MMTVAVTDIRWLRFEDKLLEDPLKAAVLYRVREPLVVEEAELDAPRQGEVRVRLAASGVCHSCLHAADGSWGAGLVPSVLGDEGAGVVEEVGPGVQSLQPGDHVILSWSPTCGRCRYCVSGRPQLCERPPAHGRMYDGTTRMHVGGQDVYHFGPSTYASETVVPENCAIKIRDDMPLDKAALIGCAVMTGAGAVINTARVPVGASLAVFGTGGIGLNAIQGGHLCGAYPLIAVDVADSKLEFAKSLGATHTVNSAQEDVVAAIKQLTAGRGAEYTVVAVGNTGAIEQAWNSLAPGGTCVVIGAPATGERISVDPAFLYRDEKRLTGSRYGSARVYDDFARLVDLYLGGKLELDRLITHQYALEDINEAHRALAAGENMRGIVMF